MTVNILIADDHGLLRAGLRSLLSRESDINVVGEASNGDDTLDMALQLQPDVVLADISMPGPSGIEVADRLKRTQPDTKVVILTMHEDGGLLQEAMRAGARGYIVKHAAESDLINAIRTVAEDGVYVHNSMSWALAHESAGAAQAQYTRTQVVSDDELELIRMLASGFSNEQIEDSFAIDSVQLEERRSVLAESLNLRSRVDMIRFARANDLI